MGRAVHTAKPTVRRILTDRQWRLLHYVQSVAAGIALQDLPGMSSTKTLRTLADDGLLAVSIVITEKGRAQLRAIP